MGEIQSLLCTTQGSREEYDTTIEQETELLLLDTVSLSIFGTNFQNGTLPK